MARKYTLSSLVWALETSLEETRGIVRRKLGLKDDAGIQLAQIRGGSLIVLEDGRHAISSESGPRF